MIIFLFGENSYSSLKYLNGLIEKFRSKNSDSFSEVVVLDFEFSSWPDVFNHLFSYGIFGGKKLIVLKNIFSNPEASNSLLDFMSSNSLAQDIYLVIYENRTPDKRTSLFKLLSKEKYSREFRSPQKRDIEAEVDLIIKSFGKKIDKQALFAVSEACGVDMWRAKNEAEKLSNLGKDQISAQDVNEMVFGGETEDIWKFVDAVLTQNKKTAFELLDKQLENAESVQQFLGAVANQFRVLIAVFDFHGSDYELSSRLGVHPYVIKKTRSQSKFFDMNRLKFIYQAFKKLDIALKTSSSDPKVLFSIFLASVFKVCKK